MSDAFSCVPAQRDELCRHERKHSYAVLSTLSMLIVRDGIINLRTTAAQKHASW